MYKYILILSLIVLCETGQSENMTFPKEMMATGQKYGIVFDKNIESTTGDGYQFWLAVSPKGTSKVYSKLTPLLKSECYPLPCDSNKFFYINSQNGKSYFITVILSPEIAYDTFFVDDNHMNILANCAVRYSYQSKLIVYYGSNQNKSTLLYDLIGRNKLRLREIFYNTDGGFFSYDYKQLLLSSSENATPSSLILYNIRNQATDTIYDEVYNFHNFVQFNEEAPIYCSKENDSSSKLVKINPQTHQEEMLCQYELPLHIYNISPEKDKIYLILENYETGELIPDEVPDK